MNNTVVRVDFRNKRRKVAKVIPHRKPKNCTGWYVNSSANETEPTPPGAA